MSRTVIDPITFEVLRNAFMGACNEMAVTVAKTAYSSPINEGNDYATAVYSPDGKLVCQGESDLPAFIGLTMLTVPEVRHRRGERHLHVNDPCAPIATTWGLSSKLARPSSFAIMLARTEGRYGLQDAATVRAFRSSYSIASPMKQRRRHGLRRSAGQMAGPAPIADLSARSR